MLVFWGMAGGVVASLLLAVVFKHIQGMTKAHEELFEGSVMLIASGMLAYCGSRWFCVSDFGTPKNTLKEK